MKKHLKLYTIVWLLSMAMLNVIVFAIPAEIAGIYRFTNTFWIGYVSILIACVGQYVCAFLTFKDVQRIFYNISLVSVSYIGLSIVVITGSVFMALPVLPIWIAIIVCFTVLMLNFVAVMKAGTMAQIVSDIDKKVKTKSFFIRSLTIDAENVMNQAPTAETKALAEKVYEEIRYSDPMSDDTLAGVEAQISIKFEEFSAAVSNGDVAIAQKTSFELIAMIKNRNKKCTFLKMA